MQTSYHLLISPKRWVIFCWIAIAVLSHSVPAAVIQAQDDPERKRAFQVFRDGNYTEAVGLFEKLEKTYPEDSQILETYGFLLFTQTINIKDLAARKDARKRAREVMLRAKKAGANSALLNNLIESIAIDGGGDVSFSPKKEVDEAMREGEAAFANADYSKAIDMYQRALLLDPKAYEAALFTGDVYFKQDQQAKAGEWFARAVEIDPNRETAYRYWGDSLTKQGRASEAGKKFVEAFIAEPYNRLARAAFVSWGEKMHMTLAHPRVDIPTSVTPQQNGNLTINIDPNALKNDDKSGSGAAWVMYGLMRASWLKGEFAKQYPTEKTYRHSLKEESAAIRAALKVLSEPKNADIEKSDPSLKVLAKLDKEGLLEAFVLLAMPDNGVAQDYAWYRAENVEKLRRYVVDYVMTGGVGKNQ